MSDDTEDPDKLVREALMIEAEEALQAGAVGFIARALTQATMPHKATSDNEFTRQNGHFTLTMMSPRRFGLPYGSIPRLLVSWITTEAVRTKSPVLELGPSLSAFMAELGLAPTGGRWGSITRLRDQMTRLFASSVTCTYDDKDKTGIFGVKMVKEAHLWWNPKAPDEAPLWKSTLTLGTDFYEEVIKNPVPVDMRALKALKRSPMALDIYCWLTYRPVSYTHLDVYKRQLTACPICANLRRFRGLSYKCNSARITQEQEGLKNLFFITSAPSSLFTRKPILRMVNAACYSNPASRMWRNCHPRFPGLRIRPHQNHSCSPCRIFRNGTDRT